MSEEGPKPLDLSECFQGAELEGARALISEYHGRLLISDRVSDSDAILLLAYMVCNRRRSPKAPKAEVKELFAQARGDSDKFAKRLYDLRQGKGGRGPLVVEDPEGISLTFAGLERVRAMLEEAAGRGRAAAVYAELEFGGSRGFRAARALVDTGTPYCVLPRALAEEVGAVAAPWQEEVRLALGEVGRADAALVRVRMGGKCVSAAALIADVNEPRVGAIVLSALGAEVDLARGEVRVG